MSYREFVQVALNTENEQNVLNHVLQEIDNCSSFVKDNMQAEINGLKQQVTKSIKQLQLISSEKHQENSEILVEYQKQVDHIMKEISNLKSAINFGDIYTKLEAKEKEEINSIIKDHGIMAIIAIDSLKEKFKKIDANNLKKEIEKIRNEELEKAKHKQVCDNIEDLIFDLKIDKSIQSQLVKLLNKVSSAQEAMDLSSLLKNLEIYNIRMGNLATAVENSLTEIKFKINERTYGVEEDGIIAIYVNASNASSKSIQVKIKSNGSMEWETGNYEGHLCDGDAGLFKQALLDNNVQTSNPTITRTTSNRRPLRKSAAIKGRSHE